MPGPKRSKARKLADAAGMSRGQMWRAMQVADIPEAEFEAMVESDEPPTVSQLVKHARRGKPSKGTRAPGRRIIRCPHCGEAFTDDADQLEHGE